VKHTKGWKANLHVCRDVRDKAKNLRFGTQRNNITTFISIVNAAAMPPHLPPTNMSVEDMVPDTANPAHDPRFWCLPPVRDKPSERDIGKQGKFPLYLVTQGQLVGVWHNWWVFFNHPAAASVCSG
jgi:hypothetical protein